MSFTAQNISYILPSGETLFSQLYLSVAPGEKAAITGDNGRGKSTLLKIIAGILQPNSGSISLPDGMWYVPQQYEHYNNGTVAEALHATGKLAALHAIQNGQATDHHFLVLDNDWAFEDRCMQALQIWNLEHIQLSTSFASLSGGEKTRLLLAGMDIHQARLVLLDEPTNHLDMEGRTLLYERFRHAKQSFLVVSHDRQLLALCNPIHELSNDGIHSYGGNYYFYEAQKQEELQALERQIQSTEQAIRVAKIKQAEAKQRQQKKNIRSGKRAQQEGIPLAAIHGLRNKAEYSLAKLENTHEQKNTQLQTKLEQLRTSEQELRLMKIEWKQSQLHKGKILAEGRAINFSFNQADALWPAPLDFVIRSGNRIRLAGSNGSGKSTLIRLLTGQLSPSTGELKRADCPIILLDQEYSLIQHEKTVLELAEEYNDLKLEDHLLKSHLTHFLFDKNSWNKTATVLSGGEMLRLVLCCLSLKKHAPDMLILDEPTNNLDLHNIQLLAQSVAAYQGTLLVASHDTVFLEEIGIQQVIRLG